jgi:hypothetical protein
MDLFIAVRPPPPLFVRVLVRRRPLVRPSVRPPAPVWTVHHVGRTTTDHAPTRCGPRSGPMAPQGRAGGPAYAGDGD